MPNTRQILTDWTTASGGGKVSVTYWTTLSDVEDQRQAWADFLDACLAACDDSVTYTVRTSGVEVDASTGTLTGQWTDANVQSNTGAGSGQPVADATQILVRWKSNTVVNGRFVGGRTFIPGMGNGNLVGGNIGSSAEAAIEAGGTALIGSGTGFSIWHRPIAGIGGQLVSPNNCDVWTELAVLRRRRG